MLEHNLLRFVCPDWFLGLTNLKVLHLDSNRLEILPKNVFVPLVNLDRLDLRYNAFLCLPKNISWVQKSTAKYSLGGNKLFGGRVHQRFKWQALLVSDLSWVQVKVTGMDTRLTHANTAETTWLHYYHTTTQGAARTTTYNFGCGVLQYGREQVTGGQAPYVVMAVMEGNHEGHNDNVTSWCKRFWLGTETAYVNLASTGESRKQLAAFTAQNNETSLLVSFIVDPVSPVVSGDKTLIQKNVRCVLFSGRKTFRSSFAATRREGSDTHDVCPDTDVCQAGEEQGPANNTAGNHTAYAVDGPRTSNETVGNKTAEVRGSEDAELETKYSTVRLQTIQATTHRDRPTTTRPLSEQSDELPTTILRISAGIVVSVAVAICIVKRRRFCRHDDQTIRDDAVDPSVRPVVSISRWIVPSGSHGDDGGATAYTAEEGEVPAYSEIPDDYFNFNNPGYRYRRSSLPTDDNPYCQIPDEYYGYENTARQANWRPSSLPLTLGVTYENLRQDETVERWQWQPSDLDAQDEDDDVTTFYAAGAEVALPTETRSGTKHRRYEDPARISKSLRYLRMAGEIEKAVGIPYGRPAGLASRGMVERGAYGTKPAAVAEVSLSDVNNARTGHANYESPARLSKSLLDLRRGGRQQKKTDVTTYGRTSTRDELVSRSAGDVLETYQGYGAAHAHRSRSQEMLPSEDMGAPFARTAVGRRHSI
ncbi:Hypp8681 [Branchiostoma lanceolatum]|uniref:Hypp8681 protein n=1 Tax=Branchiostoma lanceolatum TaxID=7740 RepID=A0A8K0EG81_BRALA|nr:Hypp8681 [Branchiostoma lanceolatum]